VQFFSAYRGIFGLLDTENPAVSEDSGIFKLLDFENPAVRPYRGIFGLLDTENPAVSEDDSTSKIPRSTLKMAGFLDYSTSKNPPSKKMAGFSEYSTPKITRDLNDGHK
jgi:hypothetical protein